MSPVGPCCVARRALLCQQLACAPSGRVNKDVVVRDRDLVGAVDEVGVVAVEANHVGVVADRVDVDAVVDLAAEADDRRDAALGGVRDCVRCVVRMMLTEANWRVVGEDTGAPQRQAGAARARSWLCIAPDATAVRANPVALRCVRCGDACSDRDTP